MASTFVQQLAMADPLSRLVATLERLEHMRARAVSRQRAWGSETYADPDTNAAVKCEELAARLMAEHWARTMASVESIGTLDRAQAIAELEAVLAAWKDPAVSDEQWRASRVGGLAAPEVKPRAGVVRRKKT